MSELVVLAGQSNAGVFHLTPGDLPTGAFSPDPHVQIWTASGFQTMEPGVNTGLPNYPDSWGPEVSFATDWLRDHPGETLYLVKSVKGSTGLEPGVAPNWSPEQPPLPDGTPNGMFNKTTVVVDAAKAATGLPVSEVLWMQGEQDATDARAAADYEHNLADLFAHMRSEWGASDIVFGEISARTGFAYADEVRGAQVDVAEADVHALLVNIDQLPLQADNLHLSAQSALGLGDAFYIGAELQHLLTLIGAGLFSEPTLVALP